MIDLGFSTPQVRGSGQGNWVVQLTACAWRGLVGTLAPGWETNETMGWYGFDM
jgi:hypothetical protein